MNSNNIVSKKEYLKQLHMQVFYLTKFCINYSSSWLKPDVINCINALNSEIELYKNEIENQKKKYEQLKMEV